MAPGLNPYEKWTTSNMEALLKLLSHCLKIVASRFPKISTIFPFLTLQKIGELSDPNSNGGLTEPSKTNVPLILLFTPLNETCPDRNVLSPDLWHIPVRWPTHVLNLRNLSGSKEPKNLDLKKARLALVNSTRIVLKNGLYLLGIIAPEEM